MIRMSSAIQMSSAIRMSSVAVFAMSLLLLTAASPLFAQNGGSDGDMDREEMLERVETYFQERLARELRIEPEQRSAFMAALSEFGESRGELFPRKRELMGEVRRYLREGGSETEAEALIEDLRAIREREAALLIEEEDRLLEILRPSQVLRLQILREQFQNEILRLRDANRPDSFPGPRGRGFRDWIPGFRR
ncbi:MAG: hypothetical protein WD013_02280 [Gemmatimonadota bacterium]